MTVQATNQSNGLHLAEIGFKTVGVRAYNAEGHHGSSSADDS